MRPVRPHRYGLARARMGEGGEPPSRGRVDSPLGLCRARGPRPKRPHSACTQPRSGGPRGLGRAQSMKAGTSTKRAARRAPDADSSTAKARGELVSPGPVVNEVSSQQSISSPAASTSPLRDVVEPALSMPLPVQISAKNAVLWFWVACPRVGIRPILARACTDNASMAHTNSQLG